MERLDRLISRMIRASVGSLFGGGATLLAGRWTAERLDFDDPASAFKDLQGLFGTALVAAIGFGLAGGVWLALGRGTMPLTAAVATPVIVLGLVLIAVMVGPDELSTGALLAIYLAAGATSTLVTSMWVRKRSSPM
jgi:hypothetical protein